MRKENLTFFLFFSTLLLASSSAYSLSIVLAEQNPTSITCVVSNQTVTYGEYVNISGRLIDVSTGQGLKRTINLTYSEDNGTTWKQLRSTWESNLGDWGYDEINTTDDGYFGPYKWYPEHLPHDILIKAFWTGDGQYEPSESAIQTLKVDLPPSFPIAVLSHRSYVWGIPTLWVVGEIRNEGSTNLEWAKIAVVYYDVFGKIVAVEDDFYATLHIIAPGERSPFISIAPLDASLIASHEVVVRAYQNATEEPCRDFQILNDGSWFDEDGNYHLSGELKNTGTILVKGVEVFATFYSANETVLDYWWDTSYLTNYTDVLGPNDTRSFDIEVSSYRLEAIGTIDHYVLQVDSYPVMTSSSISCDVSPSEVRLGGPVTVWGIITPSHEMANVTLHYTWQDSTLALRTVFTDAIGIYNDTFTPNIAGEWNVNASWPGDFDSYGASSSRAYFNVSKIPASISCFVSSENIQLGENINITGSVSPALERVNATLTFIKPDKSTFTQDVTVVDGEYAYTYEPESSGSWYVRANWLGDINYEGTNSTLAYFNVSKIPASISCFVSSEKIQLGENITITGFISPAFEMTNATLTFIRPDSSVFTQDVTVVDGEYAYAYEPESSGSWYVRASWPGNTDYDGANSTLAAFAVEFLTPVRQIAPPENAVVAIAVGTSVTVGITASMSLSGFAQSFNEAVSKLPVPKWFKDFLNLYGEKTFETLTKEELLAAKRKKMITLREILSLLFAGAILLGVFIYVEVNGMPNLLNVEYLLATVPQVLVSVVLVFALSQVFSIISAKTLDVCCEFKIWLYGLLALLITGIVFMIPFASPGRVEYQGDIDPKRAGLTATSKILCILILCIPFYVFYAVGFTTVADAGLMMTMMTACYSAFPFKPLEGKEIFRYRKGLWIVTFVSSFSMFVCTIFSLLPRVAYLLTGTAATLLFVGLIFTLKR